MPNRKRRSVTADELRKFHDACELLTDLAKVGLHVYLANDTMCLMIGPSHDDKARPMRDNIAMTTIIPGASGGDW